jgi:hypothetical protein
MFDMMVVGVTSVLTTTHSLKTVVLDGELVNKFMELAQGNTIKGIETCGILAAKSV